MKGLFKRIEDSYKIRAPFYEKLGVPMHEDPVWVEVVWKQVHPESQRDYSPLEGDVDE